MKERPILFSAPMVRALLTSTKTQTRRVIKPAPQMVTDRNAATWAGDPAVLLELLRQSGRDCPYGQPGDLLWVRETFGYVSPDENERPHSDCNIEYRADLPDGCTDRPGQWPVEECVGDPARPRWRPSIHMPRAASRILLEIVSVRVERLNDCSEADALAEGIDAQELAERQDSYDIVCKGTGASGRATAQSMYRELWDSINGPGSWEANPWVWVVEFRLLEVGRIEAGSG